MYASLAWRNIRRSLSDYAVYFVTLVFAVALFYVFNSLGDQPVIAQLAEQERFRFQFMEQIIAMVSVFVSLVIGVLVMYANSFLIRRRKRELGTYMLLGMQQVKVASLLFAESILIGTVALGAGLALGVLFSQFLAIVVVKLFEANMDSIAFVLSAKAALKTALFYGLSFLFVGAFGSISVSRVKLAELVDGGSRTEPQLLRVTWLQAVVLLVSLGLIGWGYHIAFEMIGSGMIDPRHPRLWLIPIFCSIGTYGLYYGLSGMAFRLFTCFKGMYYRGLNPFVFRQATSRINSSVRILATITIMLTVTICALGAGFALRDNLLAQSDSHAPYDIIIWGGGTNPDFAPIYEVLAGSNAIVSEVKARKTDMELVDFYRYAAFGSEQDARWLMGENSMVSVLPVSLFNQLRGMRGYSPVEVGPGQYLIYHVKQWPELDTSIDKWLQDGRTVSFAGRELVPGSERQINDRLGGFIITGNGLTSIVVEDVVAKQLPVRQVNMMINFAGDYDGSLDKQLADAAVLAYGRMGSGFMSRYEIWHSQMLSTALLVFAAIYIGLVFLMASATALSLQQLGDATEHRHKYSLLCKIGADQPLLAGALLRQLSIYFFVPVTLAGIHSWVALSALNSATLKAGGEPIMQSALVTGGVFIAIYGIYFVLTHVGYKRTLGWR